jgi:replicative DNA helicase
MSEIAGDITDDMTVSYPTGFKHFDDVFMGGLKEGDLMFITGYSGLGKSTIMQSMTYNLDKIGQPTMWFTFEVPVGELWRKFKDMGVTDNFQAYAPEKIITTNMNWVEKKILEARDRFKTKIVFIDHLGFLAMEPGNYDKTLASNLSTILSMICRRLKTLAVKEGVAIVLAGHVRKPETKKGDNAPTIHDIKDSAGVAQESDGVIVVHRKRKVGQGAEDVYESQTNVIIEKNRRTGKTKVFTVNMHSGRLMEDDEFMDKSMGL